MAKFIGRRVSVGVAKEVAGSRGVFVTPTFWIPHTKLSFDDRVDSVIEKESYGTIQANDSEFVVAKKADGDFEAEMRDNSIGIFLLALLGEVTSAVKETTAYNHYFFISNSNQHPSLSLYVDNPNTDSAFTNAMINELKINIKPKGIVEYSVGFMSKAFKDWATISSSWSTLGNKFLHQHLTFRIATNLAGLSAAGAIVKVKGLELTIKKNLTDNFVAGTVQPDDIFNQQLEVEGSVIIDFEDNTYRNLMLGGTYQAMEIDLVNPTTIGASSNPRLDMQFPRVSFSQWESSRDLDEIATQKINFTAHYDAANGDDMISQCLLNNVTTSY
jgi:hypothetical protein